MTPAERDIKRRKAKELVNENRALLQRAKNAPMFAKAAHIEQLADKTQELHELLIELL